MRKLGEQWIEVIDGHEHMFKAVTPIVNGHTDIKDLGILKDGLLPCPFCGEYPEIGHFGDGFSPITFYISHKDDNCEMMWLRSISFQTEQQAIDAWNRRA